MKITNFIFPLLILIGFYTGVSPANNFTPGDFLNFSDSIIVRDSTALDDTSKISDSLKVKTVVDTLLPINNQNFLDDDFGYKLNRRQIESLNYNGTTDLFEYLPFGFIQDLETPGQPNEVMIYGKGFGGISFLLDGIPLNYRLTNGFNPNLISSEIIDSMEILPLTSGFIYNNFNNPVTVNLLAKDKIAARPYTRIRYYQAPDEAFVDGMFNVYLMSRLNLFLNFTNRNFDAENWYKNSYSNSWKANIRARYLFSKKLSIVGTYNYSKSETGLFGGIDEGQSFGNRYQKKRRLNFDVKFLGRFIKRAPTELKFYYQFALNEFRLNEKASTESGVERIVNNNKYNLAGVHFRQKLNLSFVNIDFISNYERVEPKVEFITELNPYSIISNALKAEMPFGRIKPSVFAKNLNYNGENLSGYGFELNYEPIDNLQFFGGYSEFDRSFSPSILSYFNKTTSQQKNLQVGIKLQNNYIDGSVSFINSQSEKIPVGVSYTAGEYIGGANNIFFMQENYSGINLNSNLRFFVFELRMNGTYYFDREDFFKSFPSKNLNAGIYYVNSLFNSNLDLKTGFDFRYYGEQNYRNYDFEKNIPVLFTFKDVNKFILAQTELTDPIFVIDYFLAGRIQERAVIYFSVENILDNNYFIVPIYPARGRTIKFGFSWEFFD